MDFLPSVYPIMMLLVSLFSAVTGYTVEVQEGVKEDGITCWTCPGKGSNSECNDWAPDRFCPDERTVCQTVHKLLSTNLESVQVNKQCVLPTECNQQHVGCHTDGQTTTCTSCCNTPYCNKEVALNNDTAINLSVTVLQKSSAISVSLHTLPMILSLLPVLFS